VNRFSIISGDGGAHLLSTRILFFYILREQLKVFVLAALGITVVMNFGAVIVYLQGYPLPLGSLLKILPYHMPVLFPWIFPLAVLMATTLTYGRLASDNEILAIQMCGMHLIRPVVPALTLGILITAMVLVGNDWLLPWCRKREYEMYLQESDRILVRVFQSKEKLKGGNYTLTWEDFRNRTLYHVTVRQREGEDLVAEYTARTGTYSTNGQELTLELRDITGTHFRDGLEIRWDSHTQTIPLKGVFMREPGDKALTTAGLLRKLEEKYGLLAPMPENGEAAKAVEQQVRGLWISIYSRSGLAMSALAFALIGVPLGILARQAHMLSAFFLGCLPVMLVFYPIFLMGQSMAEEGTISAAAACWTPDAVLAVMGIGLLGWLFVR